MRTILVVVFSVSAIGVVLSAGWILDTQSQITRDVTVNVENATRAESFDDMLVDVRQARRGLEKWGITSGYAALMLRNPQNDASLYYAAFKKVEGNIRTFRDLNLSKERSSYYTTLAETRRTLESFGFPFTWHWLIHNRILISLLISLLVAGAVSGALLVWSR